MRINKNIPAEQIAESGVSSIPDSAFYKWPQGSSVTAHEMVIYTFGKGTKVTATVTNPVNNNLKACSNLKYQNPGEAEQELKGTEWQIRSRLNINATPSSPQILGTNQTITLNWKKTADSDPGTVTIPTKANPSSNSILFNENVQLAGGTGIDTSVLDLEGNVSYSLNALVFEDKTSVLEFKLPYTNKTGTVYNADYQLTLESGKTALIKLYVSGASSTNKITITKTGNGNIKDYTTGTPLVNNEITSDGVYYLLLTGPLTTITISVPNVTDISTTLDRTLYRFDEKPDITARNTLVRNKILSNLTNTGYKFDYTYIVPDDVRIDNPLDPDSFWSSNHYCSKFTIAQLDLDNSKITIL